MIIANTIDSLLTFANNYLILIMIIVFLLSIVFRVGHYLTKRGQLYFVKYFHIMVYKHVIGKENTLINKTEKQSFHMIAKKLLHRSFREVIYLKTKHYKYYFDRVLILLDKILLLKIGNRQIINESLSQTVYYDNNTTKPDIHQMTDYVLKSNNIYNRVFGIFPAAQVKDLLLILPGLFIIGGIFGTFIGIMKALPEIGVMDVSNVEVTKHAMDIFLTKIAFSMNTSIVGIILSVSLNLFNSFFNVEIIEKQIIDRYTSSFNFIWNESALQHSKVEFVTDHAKSA